LPKKKEPVKVEMTTAWELYQKEQNVKRLKTGTPIDELIGGGIREDEVIEFYGEFGAGKSQACFSLATIVEGNVVYIDCEYTFSPQRIKQIAQNRSLNPDEALQKIYVCQPQTTEEQACALNNIPPTVKPSLIIVDGVTTLFRAEYIGRENLAKKQGELRKHLSQLKEYARNNKTPTVITNQVYQNPDGTPFLPLDLRELACGGHTLYHSINNRIFIRKAQHGTRIACLVDSSEYPRQERPFIISAKGIEPLPEQKGEKGLMEGGGKVE